MITSAMVTIIQERLNTLYGENLLIDGDPGSNTMKSIAKIELISNGWEKDRQLIAAIQYICVKMDLNPGVIDGYWGPQTEYAYSQLKTKIQTGHAPAPWRDDEGLTGIPDPRKKWPIQTQDALTAFYGEVGTNQVMVDTPYPLRIEWKPEKTINRFSCHTKVADSIYRAMYNVYMHYGQDEITRLGLDLFSGCLNVRKLRGGTKYSTHSWGISIDFYAAQNKLRWGKDKAAFAKPEYDYWWKCWEDEGWVSLGRERNYDYMHIQACQIKK